MTINNPLDRAAAKLEGLTLENGWSVKRRISLAPGMTGSNFSNAYEVEKEEKKGFLKAFDFREAFNPSLTGNEMLDRVEKYTTAYKHERDILNFCKKKKLSKVVVALEAGNVHVPDMLGIEGNVFFIIFELADGTVRDQVDLRKSYDLTIKISILKDIALAIFQIQKYFIAHQDIKPSNVLRFSDKTTRLADFGRASMKGASIFLDDNICAGDPTYSTPEAVYGFTHEDFNARRFGCDLYMFGNLVSFLFTGINISSHLFLKLNSNFHPTSWGGTYHEVLPYLQDAFTLVLEDLQSKLDPIIPDEVWKIIKELCNPDVNLRGHRRGIGLHNQYSCERYVSTLDRLEKAINIKERSRQRAS